MRISRTIDRVGRALCFALAFAGCSAADGQDGAAANAQDRTSAEPTEYVPASKLVPIRVAGIEIRVEIADDEAERSEGLMFRESLPENEGMLFVYESQRALGFWMRNTLIPLDIAYIDEQGRIVDIQSMEPGDTSTHWSSSDAMYALEMNVGWFETNAVSIGDLIEF
jgi:hypothetical protein